MKVKKANIDSFSDAVFKFMSTMKNNSDSCCEVCGNLNEKELFIMVFVGNRGEVKMRDISDHLNLPLSTLTSIVDKLIDKKFLDRYHSSEDRRMILVRLGEAGKESFDRFNREKAKLSQKILSSFEENEQGDVIAIFEKVATAIGK